MQLWGVMTATVCDTEWAGDKQQSTCAAEQLQCFPMLSMQTNAHSGSAGMTCMFTRYGNLQNVVHNRKEPTQWQSLALTQAKHCSNILYCLSFPLPWPVFYGCLVCLVDIQAMLLILTVHSSAWTESIAAAWLLPLKRLFCCLSTAFSPNHKMLVMTPHMLCCSRLGQHSNSAMLATVQNRGRTWEGGAGGASPMWGNASLACSCMTIDLSLRQDLSLSSSLYQ